MRVDGEQVDVGAMVTTSDGKMGQVVSVSGYTAEVYVGGGVTATYEFKDLNPA